MNEIDYILYENAKFPCFCMQKMDASSFYGGRIEQDDSDENFIPSNVSESSSSEESDESGETEDNGTHEEEGETEDDGADEAVDDDLVPASSVAPVQGWGLFLPNSVAMPSVVKKSLSLCLQ